MQIKTPTMGKGRYRIRMHETLKALDGAIQWLKIMGFRVQAEQLERIKNSIEIDMIEALALLDKPNR